MIRQCKQREIDLILTKSIQRFARNTLDCINYTRILRNLGIAVVFEKENINSLPAESEFMITMYGAMAQSESESTSQNVKWGKKRAMEAGRAAIVYQYLYAYEKGDDDKPKVIPEQAEIVRELYRRYLAGASFRNLKDWLEESKTPTVTGGAVWSITAIKGILTNEKYCGDVLMQKTFSMDVISKKVVQNTGQLPKYLIQNHHEAIVSRETFQAVQTELARRNALKSASKQAVTGQSHYSSKYALTDRLICGECGTLYRRCVWTSKGRKYPVWRCISRLNYGAKYCHESPTLKEEALQAAILAAIHSAMSEKPVLIDHIKNAMSLELLPVQGQTMSIAEIDRRLEALEQKFQVVLSEAIDSADKERSNAKFSEILAEQTALKQQKEEILKSSTDADRICNRSTQAEQVLRTAEPHLTEWNETTIRQLVERVRVLSKDEILVRLKGGREMKHRVAR